MKFLLHVGIFLSAYLGAYLVRFEFFIPAGIVSLIKGTLPFLLLSKAIAFAVFRLYRGWWRYVSIRDILPIAAGCTLGTVLFCGGRTSSF